jgi:hypothetical protein
LRQWPRRWRAVGNVAARGHGKWRNGGGGRMRYSWLVFILRTRERRGSFRGPGGRCTGDLHDLVHLLIDHERRMEKRERATVRTRAAGSRHCWTRVPANSQSFLPVCVHVFLTGRGISRQRHVVTDNMVDLQSLSRKAS